MAIRAARVARLVRALAVVPRPAGCEKLAGVEGRLRIRQGQYRVLYSIDDTLRVIEIAGNGDRPRLPAAPASHECGKTENVVCPRLAAGLRDQKEVVCPSFAWSLDVLTLQRYAFDMDDQKRATVYFEPVVHQALRLKAAATTRSISEMVNEAVKVVLAEDAEDLAAFDKRKGERAVSFESFVRGLRQRGRI